MGADKILDQIRELDINRINQERKFKIGQVQFEMEPMPPISGWNLLEAIRAQCLGSLLTGNLMRLLSLPPDFVRDRIVAEMQQRTWFTTPAMTKGRMLFSGDTACNMALQPQYGVQPSSMYVLIGRFLCINFLDLSRGIQKMFGENEDSSENPNSKP